jgi:4-amino-4-deoxy-L-arabinose transferase-like glycosyltransferase
MNLNPHTLKKHWSEICLLVITIAGLALRLYNLTWQCLNVDEVATELIAGHSTIWIVQFSLASDYNPPLYYLIVHWFAMLTGELSVFAIRFPAVIFGTLAIPVLYLVGKEIRNKTLGLLLAATISFMFPFYYYSQDGRAYSLVLLGFSCFVYYFLRMNKGDLRWQMWTGLGTSAALCFYSHYYSLVPIAILGMILLKRERYATINALVILVLLCIPEGIFFDPGQFITRTVPQIFNVYWVTPYQMAAMLPNELLCWTWVIVIPMIAYSLYRYRDNTLHILFVTALVTALLLIPLTHFTGLSPRYALLISPLLIVVALYPVADWIDRERSAARKATIFMAIIFVFFMFNYGSLFSWMTFNVCPLTNPGLYV